MRSPFLRLVTALALATTLPACGSKATPAPSSDGDADSGGAAPGDAAPEAPDGGAADRQDVAAATADAAPTSATDVCRSAIAAMCDRTYACGGESFDNCLANANQCPDHYFNADTNRTVAGIAACLPALRARTCTDFVLGLYPACFTGGKRAEGASCAFSSQCQGNLCASGGKCGACPSALKKVGEACRGFDCEGGSFCVRATHLCAPASVIVYAKEGEPCDLDANPPVGCAGDLICPTTPQTGRTAGVCTPAPGVGKPCASTGFSDMICARGLLCTAASNGTCATIGACGGTITCDASTYCALDGGFRCLARARVGEACSPPGAVQFPQCLAPTVCAGTPAVCTVLRKNGEPCDATHTCELLLTCGADGKCEPTVGIQTCP